MKTNEPNKRLRRIILDNMILTKDKVLDTGDFEFGDIDKFEEDIKKYIRQFLYTAKELDVVIQFSWIGDFE